VQCEQAVLKLYLNNVSKEAKSKNMYTNNPKWSHKEMQHISQIKKNKKKTAIDINITQMMVGKQPR